MEALSFVPSIRADEIETAAYGLVAGFLESPNGFDAEVESRRAVVQTSAMNIRRELDDLHPREKQEQEAEARAFRMFTRGKVSEEVYEQKVALIRTRRRWIREQRERLVAQLFELERHSFSSSDMEMLRRKVQSRLLSAGPSDRRYVLEAVGVRVLSHGDGSWEMQLEIPQVAPTSSQIVSNQPEWNYT